MIERFDIYLGLIINGLFTGLGFALGTYFVNKKLIKKIDMIEKKLKVKLK